MSFPDYRAQRSRALPGVRRLLREHQLSAGQLIQSLWVRGGSGVEEPLRGIPGLKARSADKVAVECQRILEAGIPAVYLQAISDKRDDEGAEAFKDGSPLAQAVRAIKKAVPELVVMVELGLSRFTSHGHPGILARPGGRARVDHDASLEVLGRAAVTLAKAGADFLAPVDLLDGRVGYLRESLDEAALDHVGVLSGCAVFASAWDAPVLQATGTVLREGDRRDVLLDVTNTRQALREAEGDASQGADLLLFQPATAALDVIKAAADELDLPLVAHHTAGEYAVVMAGHEKGLLDGPRALMEALWVLRRAGADAIITPFAVDAAARLTQGERP